MKAKHLIFNDISHAMSSVLKTADPQAKVQLVFDISELWLKGEIGFAFTSKAPDRPSRPEKPELLLPAKMPKRRKAGNLENRKALLHAVCHIELNAIDLACDIAARFGGHMPRDFTSDWLQVAHDEARHFLMLNDRLKSLDCFYGAMPAHDGLWQSAMDTAHDLAARLSVVPMVLEARGLDVTPNMINRFERFKDQESADILKIIYEEEITHVEKGTKWFNYLADKKHKNPEIWFQELVTIYFKGYLKPPFNKPARDEANLPQDWYEPLIDQL